MRKVADEDRIRRFMRALGAEADVPARVYFTGGATAVLLGWRATTIDVDIRVIPESDRLYRAIPSLKESLQLIELSEPRKSAPRRSLPVTASRGDWVSVSSTAIRETRSGKMGRPLASEA